MKVRVHVMALAALLLAGPVLAGSQNLLPVPVLGDLGTVVLGLGLVGGGLAALRRRRS